MTQIRYSRSDVLKLLEGCNCFDVVVSDAPAISAASVDWSCSFKTGRWPSTSSATTADCTRDAAKESLLQFERAIRLPPRCFVGTKIVVKRSGASVSFKLRIPREFARAG